MKFRRVRLWTIAAAAVAAAAVVVAGLCCRLAVAARRGTVAVVEGKQEPRAESRLARRLYRRVRSARSRERLAMMTMGMTLLCGRQEARPQPEEEEARGLVR